MTKLNLILNEVSAPIQDIYRESAMHIPHSPRKRTNVIQDLRCSHHVKSIPETVDCSFDRNAYLVHAARHDSKSDEHARRFFSEFQLVLSHLARYDNTHRVTITNMQWVYWIIRHKDDTGNLDKVIDVRKAWVQHRICGSRRAILPALRSDSSIT